MSRGLSGSASDVEPKAHARLKRLDARRPVAYACLSHQQSYRSGGALFDMQALQHRTKGPILAGRTFDRFEHNPPSALDQAFDPVPIAIAPPWKHNAEITRSYGVRRPVVALDFKKRCHCPFAARKEKESDDAPSPSKYTIPPKGLLVRHCRAAAGAPLQVRVEEGLDIAVEHALEVSFVVPGALVLHTLVGVQKVVANLRAKPGLGL